MRTTHFFRALAAGMAAAFAIGSLVSAAPAAGEKPKPGDTATYVQVTATRVPEDVEAVPSSITLVTGDEMRARGARTLWDALSLVGGVSIAPGGDGGPAGSVPEIWGLREFDAFLLVVDGVPWGGAFNPDLPTVSLENVDRIEVLRGAAPVMYGATSFTGVIQVIHRGAGAGKGNFSVSGGSYSSGTGTINAALPDAGSVKHSVNADIGRTGYKDDRTELGRGHVAYQLTAPAGAGRFRFNADVTGLRQDPASPHPRVGDDLTDLVPLDVNHNPSDARLDQNRFHAAGGYDRDFDGGTWSVLLSVSDTSLNTVRGFLVDPAGLQPDAAEGFTQDLSVLDSYLDVHVALHPAAKVKLVTGLDYLYGRLHQDSELFDYTVGLDGSNAQALGDLTPVDEPSARDQRNFAGLYAQMEWTPMTRLRVDAGARLNRTHETREVPDLVPDSDSMTVTRMSGTVGLSWLAWSQESAGVWLFGDYRNTFKPAAFDFGPDPEAEILDPETAVSYEIGVKGRHDDSRYTWQFSAFQMDFTNLVVSNSAGGFPTLVNAGDERFRGAEIEGTARLSHDLHVHAGYSLHDARFVDSVQDFGGVPTQLAGNQLEMSARNMASVGVVWAPATKWTANSTANYVGTRFLNKRNTAPADAYVVWNAGVGYRFPTGTLRLDGWNLGDTRPPVSESELGDAQYYRMPARSFGVSWSQTF